MSVLGYMKKSLAVLALVLMPAAAMALQANPSGRQGGPSAGSSFGDLYFVPPSLQPDDTFLFSDGFSGLIAGGFNVGPGQFQINITNDFAHAGTFVLGQFFINGLNGATFSLSSTTMNSQLMSSTGPFSIVMNPGETLVLTVTHDWDPRAFLSTSFTSLTTVPVPPAILLMLSALGFGVVIRKRRNRTDLQAA